jgi:hypothetical protein
MSGYGVPVGLGERAGGERCPQCGESDLRPYGNGSKQACPRCHFLVPCCEGGELAARRSANLGRGSADGGPGAAVLKVGRSRPGGCRLGPGIVTSLVVRVSQLPKRR